MEDIERLNEIKILLKTGQIDYDEARIKAQPILDLMNKKGEVIAKKFGKKYSKISFTGFMR